MSQPNDVTARHKEYQRAVPDWELVEDVVAGERTIKEKGEQYLPKPNPTDTSAANTKRFEQYVKRAVFYNATGRTLSGLVGIAFRKWPEIDIPPQIAQLELDATGSGIPLIQSAQNTVLQVMTTGRAGLLVDYPTTDGKVSRAQEASGEIRPTICFYPARAITNWRTAKVGSKVLLTLIVLKECYLVEDGFAAEEKDQYRVLRLTGGLYTADIYRKAKNTLGEEVWVSTGEVTPLQGSGQPWREIPFQFVGSHDNDVGVDSSPILDLANVNIAHYRNSADYEDSVYLTGQPQPWMSGLDTEWRDTLIKQGVHIGSRVVLPLPVNGAFGIAQAQPNTLAKEAMDQKEVQMAALGARLIQAGIVNKTATQQDSEDATAHSVLSLVCDNTSAAYKQALTWAARFANGDEKVEFSIPTEFAASALDAQMLTALLAMVQAGKMPEADFWTQLRNAGFIDSQKTDEDIREEISTQSPTGTADALNAPGGEDSIGQGAQGAAA